MRDARRNMVFGATRIVAGAAALSVAAWASQAQAVEPICKDVPLGPTHPSVQREPPANRFYLGFTMGSRLGLSLDIDGRSTEGEGGAYFQGGMTAAYDRRIVRWLSLGAMGRVLSWDSNWSSNAGFTRWYWDIDIVPRLRTRAGFERPHGDLYLAFPFGLTLPGVADRGPHRAVKEEWSSRVGWNAGIAPGLELWGKHFGAFFELGYHVHAPSLRLKSSPVGVTGTATTQTLSYVDHQVLLTIGGTYGL